MRFVDDGPPIPSALIKARDDGSVVFLCGAGISGAAGLPGFEKLTLNVLEDLGVELKDDLKRQIHGYEFDKIFSRLEEDFGRMLVVKSVHQFLQTDAESFAGNHQSILTLSENKEGRAQVITTNFDLLFEKAATESGRDLKSYQSGSFPSLVEGGGVNGLVYLHGRMADGRRNGTPDNLVLSQADFGRAYLAGGLARQMLLEVIQSKNLVLLGYSGNDPVVQYLFQGLSGLPRSAEFRIFAFTSDGSQDACNQWERRGVTPLVYDSAEGHDGLWKSLEQWAAMTVNPAGWSKELTQLCQKSPLELSPHERGQVTNMVKTRHGAREFASCEPRPPRSWLLVFDGPIRKRFELGIDDDPPVEGDQNFEDFLSAHTTDDDFEAQTVSLASYRNSQEVDLPPRLQSLRTWICSHCDDAIVIWWLAGHRRLGPSLLWDFGVEYERRKSDLKGGAYGVLSLLHDRFRDPPLGRYSFDWYGFESQIRNHGWGRETLREFRRVTKPRVKAERGFYSDSLKKLVQGDMRPDELSAASLVNFEVLFPMIQVAKIDIPNELLYGILRILSDHLDLASSYLKSVEPVFLKEGTLHQPEVPDFYEHEHQLKYLHETTRIFDSLVKHDPRKAQLILSLWDSSDENLQGQLVLYALHHGAVLGVESSANKLQSLPDSVFWAAHSKRERLFALSAIWTDLSQPQRTGLEERILQGDLSYPSDEPGRDRDRQVRQAALTLGYLVQNGYVLSNMALARYEEIIQSIENWRDEWCRLSDEEFDRGAKCVITNEDATELLNLPIAQILCRAAELSGRGDFATENAPFTGLLKLKPRRAFLALLQGTRVGKIPVGFWRDFLSEGPVNELRLSRLLIERVISLPEDAFCELCRSFISWCKKNAEEFFKVDQKITLKIWSRILDRFTELPEKAFKSGMGRSFSGGKELNRSPQSYTHAINSVAGDLVGITISLGRFELEEKERRVPDVMSASLERLLSLPGDGKSAAASILGLHSCLFHWWSPEWHSLNILPLVDENSPVREAALNGIVYQKYVPDPEYMRLYRPGFLSFIDVGVPSAWDDNEIESLISKIVCSVLHPKPEYRVFSPVEIRNALKSLGRHHASYAIHIIRKLLKQENASWENIGAPFFKRIWPKEAVFQTESSSSQVLYLLIESGENFPLRVEELIELLRPIEHSDTIVFQLEDEDSNLWQRFPGEVIRVLDRIMPDKSKRQPHNLIALIEKIVSHNSGLRSSPSFKSLMERA